MKHFLNDKPKEIWFSYLQSNTISLVDVSIVKELFKCKYICIWHNLKLKWNTCSNIEMLYGQLYPAKNNWFLSRSSKHKLILIIPSFAAYLNEVCYLNTTKSCPGRTTKIFLSIHTKQGKLKIIKNRKVGGSHIFWKILMHHNFSRIQSYNRILTNDKSNEFKENSPKI
jgi:hypothetical protein